MTQSSLSELVRGARDRMHTFAQRLVQTPSLSGQERDVANLVYAEMQALGYHDLWRDEIGNVVSHDKLDGNGGKSLAERGDDRRE